MNGHQQSYIQFFNECLCEKHIRLMLIMYYIKGDKL